MTRPVRRERESIDGPDRVVPALAGPRLAGLRQLARDGTIVLRIRGDCMAPRLCDGEDVTVRAARLYWPGDILALAPAGHPVAVHRLLGWRPQRWTRPWRDWRVWTQGDQTDAPDAPLAADRVLGKVAVAVAWRDRARAVRAFVHWLAVRGRARAARA